MTETGYPKKENRAISSCRFITHATIIWMTILFCCAGRGWCQFPSAPGWYDIPNTKLHSVCPPDGYNGAQNFNYAFNSNCPSVVAAWSGGIADTKRNRLLVWGGGHVDYYGNEVYAFDLNNLTMTRLNNPSPINNPNTGSCVSALSDGSANARHTYGGLSYIANADKMYVFSGIVACPSGGGTNDTWTLDLASLQWKSQDPTTGSPPSLALGQGYSDYDPNTGNVFVDAVINFFSYNYASNTYTPLNNNQNWISTHASAVIDPKRKLFIIFGPNDGNPWGTLVYDISSGSNYQLQNWTSQTTGCSALQNANFPGLAYDSALDRIVGWAGGNTVYLFNPDTKTCTPATFPNGPGIDQANGTHGRFRYFPALDAFALVNSVDQDAFILKLSSGSPAPDTTPPTVAITSPINGATVAGSVTVSGTAADNVSVSQVQVAVDGGTFAPASGTSSWTFSLNTTSLANGSHTLTAKATDSSNNSANSSIITVTVSNITNPPAGLGAAWSVLNRMGDGSSNEQQCHKPANASVANSILSITAKNDAGITCPYSELNVLSGDVHVPSGCTGSGANYTCTENYSSAMVEFNPTGTFPNFTYGTIEIRAQLGNDNSGLQSVLWLLGANCQTSNLTTADNQPPCNWPQAGSEEIDIIELQAPSSLGQNFYAGACASSICKQITPSLTTTQASGAMHVYQLIWAPGSLTWKVDGATTGSYAGSAVPSTPMFLLMDNTLRPTISGVPATLQVDYVKVINQSGTTVFFDDFTSSATADTTPPTVAITSPASGATVSGMTTISATASDNVGVASVQFQVDGSNTGSALTAAPYTYALDTTLLINGSHSLTAVASDAPGNTATSAAVSVTVSNAVPPPPPAAGDTITIHDTSGSAQTNRVVSAPRAFVQGEIPNFAQAVINGVGVLTQCDVKNRWPDGSLKLAVVSFVVPSIPANGSVTVSFSNQTTGNNTSFLQKSDILGTAWNFDAQIQETGSANHTLSARTILNNCSSISDPGNDPSGPAATPCRYWIKGPIATAVIFEDRSTARSYDFNTDGGSGNPLHPIFECWFYPQGSNVDCGYTVENMWAGSVAANSMRDQTYAFTLTSGNSAPTTLFTQSSFNHIGRSRWYKEFWAGNNAPAGINIDFNCAYMTKTQILPNYDCTLPIPASMLSATGMNPNQSVVGDVNGAGIYPKAMDAGGAADTIGLMPLEETLYWMTANATQFSYVIGYNQMSGRVPFHYREADTNLFFDNAASVNAFGRVPSINARANENWGIGPSNSYNVSCGGSSGQLNLGPVSTDGWDTDGMDASHWPQFALTAYLTTGKFYYMEEAQLAGAYMTGWTYGCPGPDGSERGGSIGMYWQPQYGRGAAWAFRSGAWAWLLSPDNSPEKNYFFDKTSNHIIAMEGFEGIPNTDTTRAAAYSHGVSMQDSNGPSPLHTLFAGEALFIEAPLDTTAGHLLAAWSPWEESYTMAVYGMARDFGLSSAATLLQWDASRWFHIALDTANVNNIYLIGTYRIPTKLASTNNWIQNYSQYLAGYTQGNGGGLPTSWTYFWPCGYAPDDDKRFEGLATLGFMYPYTADGFKGSDAWNLVKSSLYNSSTGCLPQAFNTVINNDQPSPKWDILARTGTTPPPPPDTTPPSVPTGLTAVAVSSTQINLSWNASTDNVGVAGYKVFRGGSQIATTASTSFLNAGLAASTAYTYTVSAFDAAGNNSAPSTAVSAVTLPPPAVDTVPPTVSITAPGSGTTVAGTITVAGTASDNVGVAGVQFKLDGANLGAEDTSTPYTVSWNTTLATNANHTLTAVARDAAGNTATSASVTVTVNNAPPPPPSDTTPPTVSITFPTNGAAVAGNVTVLANASDNVAVANVQFKLDGANLGSPVTASPYSVPWNTTLSPTGPHTLSAVATDTSGNAATSAMVNVTVSTATILQVGPTRLYKTVAAASAAARDGNIIEIDAGVYSGSAGTSSFFANNLTVRGVGGARAVIPANGADVAGKGIWVVDGSNFTAENIEFSGASVVDMNGAGIRAEGLGSLTVRNCYFHDNQDGILGPDAGDALIENSIFDHNGAGDGFSHNIYVGTANSLTFRYSYTHRAVVGHNLKTRAMTNFILYNRIMDESDGTASYDIDIPQGGVSYVVGNVIEKGPNANNTGIVAYAAESALNGALELYAANNTMINDRPAGATFLQLRTGTTAKAINNIMYGPGTPWSGAAPTASNNYIHAAYDNAPKFLSPGTYDFHLTSASPSGTNGVVDAGTSPGSSPEGFSLTPTSQYVYDAQSAARSVVGSAIDIGAFELSGSTGAGGSGDTTPPSVPTSLSAVAISSTQIVLSWSASTDNVGVAGYKVFRCQGSGCIPSAQVATTASTSLQDTGLIASTTYTYAVSAFDAAGNVSTLSASAGAITLPTTVPPPPPADTTPPTVSLISPANGATLSGTVAISAAASDNVGVTKVELYLGTALVATDTAVPYGFSWNTKQVANSSYTLTAKAYDAAGNIGMSAPVNVKVSNRHSKVQLVLSPSTSFTTTALGSISLSAVSSNSNQANFAIEVDTAGEPSFPIAPTLQVMVTMPSGLKNVSLSQLSTGPLVYYAKLPKSVFGNQDFAQLTGTTVTITVNGLTFGADGQNNVVQPALGGTIQDPLGLAAVVVQPGQVSMETQVNITPAASSSNLSNGLTKLNSKALGNPINIQIISSGTVSGTTIVIPFDPTLISTGLTVNQVSLAYQNPVTGDWLLGSNVSLIGNAAAMTVQSGTTFVPALLMPSSIPGLRNSLAFPNPAIKTDPTIRSFLGIVDNVEITIFNASGRLIHSATLTGAPTGIINGQYYYDYTWTGAKATGVYFAVIHGKTTGGTVIRARTKFAVIE